MAIANHKGGVGKTGIAQGLITAAAEAGQRVLAVDMDSQGNLTRRLRAQVPKAPEARAAASLASVLQRPAVGEAARILVPCGYDDPIYSERITIAPAHLDLELLAMTAGTAASEKRLLRALHGVVDDFDLVVIDCPPQLLSHQIDIAFAASDVLLLPCEMEYDSVESARRVYERVERDRHTLNPDLAVAGIIINRYRPNLNVHQKREKEAAGIAGPQAVCPIRVHELVAIKNQGENAQPLRVDGAEGRKAADQFQQIHTWARARIDTVMGAAA
ncbi:ParA family protein [Streptomyces sp. H39-C1]|uniref:ParA family protein n=1 Tax=Streptomyces sp. H39-C1 TaxID=3004355 RepID=UPI0022AEF4F0|nr:ParA family protein [Streptomyces sp. H39-C1]MCZ4103703.1 ParA family protein [Streptomyces sp. H39-C1]